MIRLLAKVFGGGVLDRVLDTVDSKFASEADKERIKGDIVIAHYQSRASFMQAGGFWLMFIFAMPLAFWFASVCIYSVFWCAGCAYPQSWSIAALPSPLDEWSAQIVIAIFGVAGLTKVLGR